MTSTVKRVEDLTVSNTCRDASESKGIVHEVTSTVVFATIQVAYPFQNFDGEEGGVVGVWLSQRKW